MHFGVRQTWVQAQLTIYYCVILGNLFNSPLYLSSVTCSVSIIQGCLTSYMRKYFSISRKSSINVSG